MISQEQLHNRIIAELPVGLLVVDADYRIIEFNPEAEKVTGMTRKNVLGRTCSEVLSSNLCEHHCPFCESIRSGEPCIGREALIRLHNGQKIPILLSSRAVKDSSGQLMYGIEIFRDATEMQTLAAHKRQLVSLFTHDLKAPATITGGFINRLLAGKAGKMNEKQTHYLQIIKKELHRQEEYIQSFLDVSRIETGRIELKRTPCQLRILLDEIVTGFRVQAAAKKIEIELIMSSGLGKPHLDKVHFCRVISNLLDNAIKYSQENSVVQVLARSNEQYVLLEVRDHGPGIAVQDQVHIFDHYYRTPARCCGTKGSGLGLAAVKAIVEAHSGSVWLHSIPGEGAAFFISLPKTELAEQEGKGCSAGQALQF
ncbi:MAG: ATP-binding protein [Candidatus Electrothrix sp. YB6]